MQTSLRQLDLLKGIFFFEKIISHTKRRRIKKVLGVASSAFALVWLITFIPMLPLGFVSFNKLFLAFFCVFFSLFLKLFLYEAYFYSMYMQCVINGAYTYELADILYQTKNNKFDKNATSIFLKSKYGKEICIRLGITMEDIGQFITTRLNASAAINIETIHFGLSEYSSALFDADKQFADFLFTHQIQKNQLEGTASWIQDKCIEVIQKERWWSKEKLDHIPSLAKNWEYGETFLLEHYAQDVTEKSFPNSINGRLALMKDETRELSILLSKGREANALILSDDDGERLALIDSLAHDIQQGIAAKSLQHKRVYLLHGGSLIETHPHKDEFEIEWEKLIREARRSGNVILVIDDFPNLLQQIEHMGGDFSNLISPHLSSNNIQIVGLSDTANFHQYIESKSSLMQHFETLALKQKDNNYLLEILKQEAITIEHQTDMFFTYQALEEIVTDAARYFSGIPSANKALDFMLELPQRVAAKGKYIIEKEDVLELVTTKTGVPVGKVNEAEKNKLLNLETILHERVVGQDDAITAISQAMRRARSGLASATRPFGSFLFLGPTGVGKTETTKALSETFFGINAPMIRLDMSEYAGSDGLAKLIGVFGGDKAGILVNALREHQYGVLLLDEFEKAGDDVHNLFLQILDEGMFSDMQGKKVNARNLIIIATSNAGSSMIFEMMKAGKKLNDSKDEIIDAIVHEHVFRPELFNRFDGVILFHPLEENHLKQVAELMLVKFQKNLKEKGFNLQVSPELISFLIARGTDPKFGARPMNRAIADTVEEKVAEALLKGELQPGSSFEMRPDLNGALQIHKI